MILLIFFSFSFLFLYFVRYNDGSCRASLVQAFVIVLLYTTLSTEFLSLINSISLKGIAAVWGLALVGVLFIHIRDFKSQKRSFLDSIGWIRQPLTWVEWTGVGVIVFILGVTLLIAVLAPPNNFDSMTYHMARVAEWIQHQNIRFYPTNIPRQNHAMPLAEFSILHLQILSRSDRFANLVQWTSFLTTIILATLITKELQGSRGEQILSGVLVATLPMAIVQSSSTQNDLVVGALCLGFAYFLLRVTREMNRADVFFSAVALGLALLTKGTAYIYCGGVGLGIGLGGVLKYQNRKRKLTMLLFLSLIMIGALLINSGHYIRNVNLYHHPLSTANSRIIVDNFSIVNTIANLIRNTAIHLGTPFSDVNESIIRTVEIVLGPFANHPQSTFETTNFNVRFLMNDDYAGNPVHVILIAVIFPLYLFQIRELSSESLSYILSVILSGIMYSVMIKWQPWGSRLQTPLFLLGVSGVGMVFRSIQPPSKSLIVQLITFSLFITCLPFLFINTTRPLIPIFEEDSRYRIKVVNRFLSKRPRFYEKYSSVLSPVYQDISVLRTDRERLYFMSELDKYDDYHHVMSKVKEISPKYLGFCLGSDDWEYPFWVLADRHVSRGLPIFQHVGIENITAKLAADDRVPPDYVIATRDNCLTIDGFNYTEIYSFEKVHLLQNRKINKNIGNASE